MPEIAELPKVDLTKTELLHVHRGCSGMMPIGQDYQFDYATGMTTLPNIPATEIIVSTPGSLSDDTLRKQVNPSFTFSEVDGSVLHQHVQGWFKQINETPTKEQLQEINDYLYPVHGIVVTGTHIDMYVPVSRNTMYPRFKKKQGKYVGARNYINQMLRTRAR